MANELVARVVIVDDSEDHRYLARRVVQKAELADEVLECPDASSALLLLSECLDSPDRATLLLLDINMPGMTGFELLDALNAHAIRVGSREAITVLIYSSSGHHSDIQRAKSHPLVDGYVVKPPVADELRKMVEAQLAGRHS